MYRLSSTNLLTPTPRTWNMYIFLCSLFVGLVVGDQLQTKRAPDYSPRFDYEYKLLERFIRSEFAQKEMETSLLQLQKKLKLLETDVLDWMEIQRQKDHMSNEHASTFVRWGKTICPGNDTELVYKGFAAGSHYTHTGGAADFLCLPEVPTWGKHVGGTSSTGLIYGAEYQLYSGSNPFSTVSIQDDASCCVCRSPRTTTLMIPGRTDCYPGWNQEYTGYLMSGYYGHAGPTNYVCVDVNPDGVFRGSPDHDGHLLYVVQARCGSLPCPPYVEGRIIACVVCSK